MRKSPLTLALLTTLLLTQSACGIFLGNVKPVDEKSQDYGVMDLSKVDPDWVKLPPAAQQPEETQKDPNVTSTEVADIAFQSKRTSSIISINSACRESYKVRAPTLQTLTHELLLGFTDIKTQMERDVMIQQKYPALETTVQGKINDEETKLRTIVLRRNNCVYDLTYVARPERFADQEPVYINFVESLRLK
jgi:hypothetical protein